MIKIPLEQVKQKIIAAGGISEAELKSKIREKMDTLSGLISEEGAAHIIANELGLKLFEQTSGKLKVKDILTGMRDVEIVGKVQQVFEVREFNTEKRSGKVGSFVLADETGSIRAVLWNEQADNLSKLKEGLVVKLVSGYVKENQMRKEVHLGERSKIILNPEGECVGEVKTFTSSRKSIKELKENDQNVELLGTIVQIFDLRFFEVCPQCSKKARPRESVYFCDEHGEVKPTYSYVMNIFLDDGTENIRAVFFRNQAEKLLERTPEQMLDFKEFPEKYEQVKHDLLGKIIKVVGRVTKNTMFDRLEFVSQLVFPNPDPEEEIKRLNKEASSTPSVEKPEAIGEAEAKPSDTPDDTAISPAKISEPNEEKPISLDEIPSNKQGEEEKL